jgi:hypothetical protein
VIPMGAILTLMCFPANPGNRHRISFLLRQTGLTLGLHGWNVSEKVVKVGGEK